MLSYRYGKYRRLNGKSCSVAVVYQEINIVHGTKQMHLWTYFLNHEWLIQLFILLEQPILHIWYFRVFQQMLCIQCYSAWPFETNQHKHWFAGIICTRVN